MSATAQNEMPAELSVVVGGKSLERRSANYKPDIWNYDLLQSLGNMYSDKEKCERHMEKLKAEVLAIFIKKVNPLEKLELIDIIGKLGLATLFEKELKVDLQTIESLIKCHPKMLEDVYFTALSFRLLRLHGYIVSEDILLGFMENLSRNKLSDVKATIELFEASHLAKEGELILEEAKVFAETNLKSFCSELDDQLSKQVANALNLPLNRRVEWFHVRDHIYGYWKENESNSSLLELAIINFNMVQAIHQKDLRDISRWWMNLGITETLHFSRNRIVESYLCATGVAFEPQFGYLRKWLTKVTKLVLIIDDVYDIYGSLKELELFTNAVNSWDLKGTQMLPDCLKLCLQTLYNTASEIGSEIQKEKGWDTVLVYIQKAWLDFCKTLLVEARWYKKGYTPSYDEYLNNAWISSCGPLLSLHAVFAAEHETVQEALDFLQKYQDLVYNTSIIIRLCNDLGTSVAELKRGDAPSSIRCFMREENVTEEVAREHINTRINDAWKKINNYCFDQSPSVRFITNTARVVHFIYENGDGFGVQRREIRDKALALFVDPITYTRLSWIKIFPPQSSLL